LQAYCCYQDPATAATANEEAWEKPRRIGAEKQSDENITEKIPENQHSRILLSFIVVLYHNRVL
jgi:hypothetical protein